MLTRREKIDVAEERCDAAFTRMLVLIEETPMPDAWKVEVLQSVRAYLHTTVELMKITLTANTEN